MFGRLWLTKCQRINKRSLTNFISYITLYNYHLYHGILCLIDTISLSRMRGSQSDTQKNMTIALANDHDGIIAYFAYPYPFPRRHNFSGIRRLFLSLEYLFHDLRNNGGRPPPRDIIRMLGIRGMPPNLLIIPNYPACAAYYEYHLHHTSDTTPADTVDTPRTLGTRALLRKSATGINTGDRIRGFSWAATLTQ